MSRLCHLGLLVVCLTGAATPTEAGCCGSGSTYGVGYTPYYTGYTPYYAGYSSYYTGYAGYYSPYASGYAAGIGCSSCQSCSSCSPCSGGNCGTGCASGNCGTGCSTTANSVPAGGLQPVADPTNGTARNVETRLEAIEKALNITPPRPNRTYERDNFNSAPSSRPRTNDTTVPGRTREDNFEAPAQGRTRENSDTEMFQEDRAPTSSTERSFKPATEQIAIPGNDDSSGTVIQSKKPAPGPSIDDKNDTTLRLDSRITSRAVAPRGRQFMSSGAAVVPTVAAKLKPQLQVDAQPRTINLARH